MQGSYGSYQGQISPEHAERCAPEPVLAFPPQARSFFGTATVAHVMGAHLGVGGRIEQGEI
jgi:hypothetical protein